MKSVQIILYPHEVVFVFLNCIPLRRSSRDDKSRAFFVIGLGIVLSTDPISLDGAR
jgi:hypothetical protein